MREPKAEQPPVNSIRSPGSSYDIHTIKRSPKQRGSTTSFYEADGVGSITLGLSLRAVQYQVYDRPFRTVVCVATPALASSWIKAVQLGEPGEKRESACCHGLSTRIEPVRPADWKPWRAD
jgi:hypothetical protein